jgi:hypothetical protein
VGDTPARRPHWFSPAAASCRSSIEAPLTDSVSRLLLSSTRKRLSVASNPVSGMYDFDKLRQMPSILRVYRVIASTVALRRSRDRSMLDLLLTIDDLPPGWRQEREVRYRVGLLYNDDWDKRARREKLVGATRTFANSETRSRVAVQAAPWATEEDARSVLAALPARRAPSFDLNAQTKEETDVTPPPEAGEHARAWLVGTTSRAGTSRKLTVVWPEQGRVLLGIVCWAPGEVEVYDVMSGLIQCQRQRLAHRGSLVSD